MLKFDKLYKSILEKVTKHKTALYIAAPIDKSQVENLYKKFPKSDMVEPELNPHMTLFYSPNAEQYDQPQVLNYLKEQLSDKQIIGTLSKFHVFKNVGDDKDQDCLVIKIDVDDQAKDLQKQIVKFLKQNVEVLQIDYPKWQPHMTIGYYKHGEVPLHDDFEPIEITLQDFFCRFGDSKSKKYKL